MRNKCKKCGANVLSGDLCWKCKPKKLLKKPTHKSPQNTFAEKNHQMQEFFLEIWKERKHYSEISGEFLGNEPKSFYFHHIMLKSKHLEAMYDRENIILLTANEHSSVHLDMYKYEEINKRRELLLIKYNIL